MVNYALVLSTLLNVASAAVLWDGRFNDVSSSADLDNWSWSNQVGPYQYYIHGSAAITKYVNLASTYKNPADTGSKQGVKISIDNTAYWNGQNMRRTELIPQTKAAINAGKVWYHYSVKRSGTNAPSTATEHQVNFFESHFTELKYGLLSGASGTSDPTLRWMVSQVTKWSTTFDADVWHNIAYEIDFSANTVGLWHSTGSSDLVQVVAPVSASTSSNGADWHLGVLRLPGSLALNNPDTEDWYFSGVYVENGSITKSVAGPGTSGGGSPPVSSSPSSAPATTATTPKSTATTPKSTQTSATTFTTVSSAPATTTTASSGGTIAQWGQCGGINWTGSGTCVSGTKCVYTNDYYSQCK